MKKCIVKKKGYTLLELMITISVIGVISALAIPAYQEYVTRTQVAESVALFDGKRIKAEEFLHLNGILNEKYFENYLTINSEYITEGIESYNTPYYDIAFLYGNNSNKPLQGKVISFFNEPSTKDNILWNCETNIEAKYLPGNLKCNFKDFNNNQQVSYCDGTRPPSLEDMPDIEGLEKVYDSQMDIYHYIKNISDDSYFSNYYGIITYNNKKTGYSVNYNEHNQITELNYEDQSGKYFISKYHFMIYSEPYSKFNNDIFQYKQALSVLSRYGNPAIEPIPEYAREEYEKALIGINSGELKEKANLFFKQFEDDYVDPITGEISTETPEMLKNIYLNIDPETMILKDNTFSNDLFDINNYPEFQNNLDIFEDFKSLRLTSKHCNNSSDPQS